MPKALKLTSQTLIGVLKSTYPVKHGNCFSVLADDDNEYKIINFFAENWEEAIKRGVALPIGIRIITNRLAVIHDGRIPDNWYPDKFCEVCCPDHLLPINQKLAHERGLMNGSRHEFYISERSDKIKGVTIKYSKLPKL